MFRICQKKVHHDFDIILILPCVYIMENLIFFFILPFLMALSNFPSSLERAYLTEEKEFRDYVEWHCGTNSAKRIFSRWKPPLLGKSK